MFPTSAGLSGFEVAITSLQLLIKAKADKEAPPKKREEASRKCHQCGAGQWTQSHVCKDADILAYAKVQPA